MGASVLFILNMQIAYVLVVLVETDNTWGATNTGFKMFFKIWLTVEDNTLSLQNIEGLML